MVDHSGLFFIHSLKRPLNACLIQECRAMPSKCKVSTSRGTPELADNLQSSDPTYANGKHDIVVL